MLPSGRCSVTLLQRALITSQTGLMPVVLSTSVSGSTDASSTNTRGLARVSVALGHAVHSQLRHVARAHGASRESTGLAALTVLLYRYTGASSLTVATRDHASDDACAHPELRLELADDTTFSSILRQVQDSGLFGGRSRTHIMLRSDRMRDVWLVFEERAAGLHLQIHYPVGPLPALHSEDLSEQVDLLLHQFALTPDACLPAPKLLSDSAAERLPNPRMPLATPSFPRVHEEVLAWAERTPAAIAIHCGEHDWSYAELAAASRTLAQALATQVEPGDTVAVSGVRSFALVSAMLAVWQRGAVVLTLDPKLPRARRELMLEQAHVRVLLSVATDATPALEPISITRRRSATDQSDAAYVFFTSGSTGTPKAVLGSHRGLAHFLSWQRETFSVHPADRAAQLTGLSFDVVLRDMFLPLTSGACLCIPRENDVVDGSRLLPWLAAQTISIIHAVPSLAASWLELAPNDLALPALRRVFFAGEPLLEGFIERFRGVFGSQHSIVNLYGPTETTLAKCYHVVGPEPEPNVQPVGRPIHDTQALVLDRAHQLCGINEPGQIAIRTPFRSWGYLDQPDATARAFVANPFGSDPDDLLYLTGDLGRYRHDGTLDILGRSDGQVKSRGVRVELGEIEATLLRSPDIAAAAVIARHTADGGTSLWAYVVPRAERGSSRLTAALRAFLQAQLPAALIPHHFIELAALPLNTNGKLDRAALRKPANAPAAAPHVEPATDRERELATQWAEILQVSKVSTDASFYELGGDSLTAMRVAFRMRAFGFDEAMCQVMLQGKTIAQLASPVEIDGGSGAGTTLGSHERMRLLLQVSRALLLLCMLGEHYIRRFGAHWHEVRAARRFVREYFTFTTPGFAIVFGLTLGFVYYPLYRKQRAQAQALLWRNALVVGVAGVLLVVLSSPASRSWQLMNVAPLFAYYALAFASAGIWFRVLSSARTPRVPLVALIGGAWAVNELLHAPDWTPPVRDWLVLVLGKYAYFGMSAGALFGVLIGIELHRDMQVRRRWWVIGASLVACAIARSWWIDWNNVVPDLEQDARTWRWAMSAGCVLGLLALLDRWFARVRDDSRTAAGLRHFGVLGQLTLPIFVLHFWSQSVASAVSAPPAVGLALDCAIVAGLTWLMLRATNRVLYGARS